MLGIACAGSSRIPNLEDLQEQLLVPPHETQFVSERLDPRRDGREGHLPSALLPALERSTSEGAVVLVKLQAGSSALAAHVELDGLLQKYSAQVLPAFPALAASEQAGARPTRLGRWVVLDLPAGVDLPALWVDLAAHPRVEPNSLTLEDAGYLRAPKGYDPKRGDWVPLGKPSEAWRVRTRPRPREVSPDRVHVSDPGPMPEALRALGLPGAWRMATGAGIGVAIVDSGVDANHLAVSGKLRAKLAERHGADEDGNGIAGDIYGASFARLLLLRSDAGLRVGLVQPWDWSDWHGAGSVRAASWGRGTVLAGLAAGSGAGGSPLGVAPGAWILPVDTEENLTSGTRGSGSIPGARTLPAANRSAVAALRTGVWARALGVAYAIDEGARVLSCGWSDVDRQPILRDVLAYAVDQCAVPVCSGRLAAGRDAAFRTLVSNPRNDATPLPDRRTIDRHGELVDLGITLGAVTLVLSLRPDLASEDVVALFAAIRNGPSPGHSPAVVRLLMRAGRLPVRRCAARAELDREPYWRGRLRSLGVDQTRPSEHRSQAVPDRVLP